MPEPAYKRLPIKAALNAVMTLAFPARFLGLGGFSWAPRQYRRGDAVPWWLEMRYPLNVSVEFDVDCTVYFSFRDGKQHVHPSSDDFETMIHVNKANTVRGMIYITGAPTVLHADKPPRRRVRDMEMAEEPA